jgi:hypothetical protein
MVATAGMLVYAWVATWPLPFTWPQRIMTAAVGLSVLGIAMRSAGRRVSLSRWWSTWRTALRHDADPYSRPGHGRLKWRAGAAVWGLLIAAVAVSELVMLFSSPRSVYLTLSAIIDPALGYRWLRFLAYLAWTALGLELARH